MKDNSEMTLSVRNALMEVLPMGVNVWKHCRECLKELACASARQLLFHTFALICKEESYPLIPNKAFVYVLSSSFPSWSAEFFMSLVCRFDRRYGDSTNIWKLKALFVCTIRQSFRRELASAKEHFLETSALGNLSDLMKAYYDEKIGSAKSLSSMIEIHGLRQNVVIADISAKVFFDEGLTMEPLGAYPDRSQSQSLDADFVGECFGDFALPADVTF